MAGERGPGGTGSTVHRGCVQLGVRTFERGLGVVATDSVVRGWIPGDEGGSERGTVSVLCAACVLCICLCIVHCMVAVDCMVAYCTYVS